MKTLHLATIAVTLLLASVSSPAQAGFFDDLTSVLGAGSDSGAGLDDSTIAKGLKEALSTGTTRAVRRYHSATAISATT